MPAACCANRNRSSLARTTCSASSRASRAPCSRTLRSRSRCACSLSAIDEANVIPVTESTMKNASSRTAFVNGVLVAKGPEPNAVSTVAIVAIKRIDNAAPLTPKRMAAHITNGSTVYARTCSLTGTRLGSPKIRKHAAVTASQRAASSVI